MPEFTLASIIPGLVFGVIGMWMFKEGKRNLNYTVLFISIALMVYPWFIEQVWLLWAVGIGLCGYAYRSW